jgi:hypothetical protein
MWSKKIRKKKCFFYSDQLKKNKRGSTKTYFVLPFCFLQTFVLSAGQIIARKQFFSQIINVLESSQKYFQTSWTDIDGFRKWSLGGEEHGVFRPVQILIPISLNLDKLFIFPSFEIFMKTYFSFFFPSTFFFFLS